MRNLRPILLPCVAALAAVSIAAAGVTVDYDHEYDFTTAKTFAWRKGTPASELNEKRIVRAVEEQLTSKNLALVPERGATTDLIVVTHASATRQTRQRARIGIGIGKSIGSRGGVSVGTSAPVGAKTVNIGTLTIEILDGASGALVWQATTSDSFGGDADKLEAQINKAVEKAFKKFPPKAKKGG